MPFVSVHNDEVRIVAIGDWYVGLAQRNATAKLENATNAETTAELRLLFRSHS